MLELILASPCGEADLVSEFFFFFFFSPDGTFLIVLCTILEGPLSSSTVMSDSIPLS